MGTKNNPGAFDCYANAEPDEPMFVLLGRDRHAAILVQLWALLRLREGEDETKVQEAFHCADAMGVWRAGLGKAHFYQGVHIEEIFFAATRGLRDHPSDFDGACDCDTCRSYDRTNA
jgi:hypothetical protein